jgi:hypothetical protein
VFVIVRVKHCSLVIKFIHDNLLFHKKNWDKVFANKLSTYHILVCFTTIISTVEDAYCDHRQKVITLIEW